MTTSLRIGLLFMFTLLGLTGIGSATPQRANWTRETLIGANEEYYFSYIFERQYPGTYFAWTDILHLCAFSLLDGSLVEDSTLSRTAYVDSTTLGDWTRKDAFFVFPDVGQYVAQKQIELAFPMRLYAKERLVVMPAGIYFETGGRQTRILTREDLNGALVPDAGEIQLVGLLAAGDYCFLIVESGYWTMDTNSSQRVFPLSMAKINEARSQLRGTK